MSKDEAQRLYKAGTDFWAWMTAVGHAPKHEARKAAERAGYISGLLAVASHIAHGWIKSVGDEVYVTEKGHQANARHVAGDREYKPRKL